MRPFLIVGCGGSGGITLQFLMDQLRADLGQRGIDELPAAWQFVHVDVPVVADGVGPGLPSVVSDQGGRYVGMASPGSTFQTVASAVSRDLVGKRRLGQLATWHADPQKVPAPIVAGAGQMRAVGRMVTLSGIKRLQEQLMKALDGLRAAGVTSELKKVARIMSPDTEGQAGSSPVILVVSSMAGGAGASMVLDVCRLLSQLPGCDPALTGLFLYTPEIFDSLPADQRNGVPGNALALMGELIASQLGAAADDDADILEALGLGRPAPGRGMPFGRVIPIGARVGASGALFGDGKLIDIYRGVGRGLAALMLSGQATNDWVNYDLTNNNPRPGTQVDVGWSATQKDLQWGSFGFASLSTGRDRYGEYAAQRVARAAVVQLLQGHRQPGDLGTDLEQRNKRVSQVYEEFCRQLGLPGTEETRQWLRKNHQLWSDEAGRDATRAVAQQFGQGTAEAKQWLSVVEHHVHNDARALKERVTEAAYRRVHEWHEKALGLAEEECQKTASTDGLPVLIELLHRVGEASEGWVRDLQDGRRHTRPDLARLPDAARARAAALRGNIDGRHQIVQVTTEAYAELAAEAALGELLELLAEVLASLRSELLEPLKQSATDAARLLQSAVDAPMRGGELAQLRTEEFSQWPDGGQPVPARFTHAQNEVLLIDASTFQAQFDAHLTETTRAGHETSAAGRADGLATAVDEVILDRWESATTPAQGRLLDRLATWRPAALPRDPSMSDRIPARRGQYRFAVRPGELLGRGRVWVGRPNLPFQLFVTTSLRDYVSGPMVSESHRAERTREVQTRFEETLELAQPLVDVSSALVSVLHDGQGARVSYKFSEVPFGGLPLGSDLVGDLEQQSHVDSSSASNLSGATKALSDKTRIDVFGSYAPLSPLTFSSLLGPLARGWSAAVTPEARSAFWYYRRARRLAGGIAMSSLQRRAVVGGWLVARHTGRLRFPGEAHALRAVEVYDDSGRGEWVSFPFPLVVPQDVLDRSPNTLLPAVLLSYGVALAQCSAAGTVGPLRPYTLLRQFWDSSESGRSTVDRGLLDARRHLQEWLRGGVPPEGSPMKSRGEGSPDEARLELVRKIELQNAHLGLHYLPPGPGILGGGDFSVPEREHEVQDYPLYHEVAADVHHATSELLLILRDERLVGGGAGTKEVSFDDI